MIAPTGVFDSERLLDLPQLQAVEGQHVVIFRGDVGRDHMRVCGAGAFHAPAASLAFALAVAVAVQYLLCSRPRLLRLRRFASKQPRLA